MSIPWPFHDYSIWNHSEYGMRKWQGPQPKSFHMDSMEWIWNGYGFHMDSIWINPGRVKTSLKWLCHSKLIFHFLPTPTHLSYIISSCHPEAICSV
jgi:hypothetical protein